MATFFSHQKICVPFYFFRSSLNQIILWLSTNLDLQTGWMLSHIVTLSGSLLYTYSIISETVPLQQCSYKLALIGTTFTYLIVLYRCFTERYEETKSTREDITARGLEISVLKVLENENTQLLGYAILWSFTGKSLLKLAPFFIYSILNVSSFVIIDLFPSNSFCSALVPLFNYLEVPFLVLASYIDLVIFGVMGIETLRFYDSAYPLLTYIFLYLTRFENSETSRSAIIFIIRFMDDQIHQELVSKAAKACWSSFRDRIKHVVPYDYTNVSDDELQPSKNLDESPKSKN